MASLMKGTQKYFNRYEAAYNRLKGQNPFFDESDWRQLVDAGDMDNINMYIAGAEKLQKEGFTAEQIFGTGANNSNTRFMSIINEAFGKEDSTVKTHFVPWSPDDVIKLKDEATAYDEKFKADARDAQWSGAKMYDYNNEALNKLNLGGQEEQLTDYEYTKRLIQNEQLTIDNAAWNQFVSESQDPNFWVKAGATAGSIGGNFVIGIDQGFSMVASVIKNVGLEFLPDLVFTNWGKGWGKKIAASWDEQMRDIDRESKGTFTNIEGMNFQDVLIDLESDYTDLRDEYGNLTTAGQIFVNAARTAGEMLALSYIGGGVSKMVGATTPLYEVAADGSMKLIGYGSKTAKLGKLNLDLARVAGTAVYYTPLTARSMSSNYLELKAADPSISTSAIIAHSLTATAAEIGIEVGLGKLLGTTGLDKWLLGGKGGNPKLLKNFGRYLGLQAKDMLQEGLEESLQEMSGIAIDNVFGLTVNENFGELSDMSLQTVGNAFIIGTLVSAGHAGVNLVNDIVTTSPIVVKSADGTTKTLSKTESIVYGYNLKTYYESVNEAGGKMADALYRMYSALPVSERIAYATDDLTETKRQLENYRAMSEIEKSTGLELDSEITDKAEKADVKQGKMAEYRTKLRDAKIKNLENKIKSIESEIKQLNKESSKVQSNVKAGVKSGDKTSAKTAKEFKKVKADLVDAFSAMVSSAKLIKAFGTELGDDQLAKAEELLTGMTDKIKGKNGQSKLDPEYIYKTLNEMTSVLQLRGIHISKKDIERLKKTGNTKLLEVYGLDEFIDKKPDDKKEYVESEEEFQQEEQALKEAFEGSNLKNIAVTEDGEKAVELEDGETLVVPDAELKQGATEVFKDLAEQKLVSELANYPFNGDIVKKIVDTYKSIYGNDKTEEEAIYAVCFDMTFFTSMLDGDLTKKIPLADSDMYQFLSSLQKLMDSVVPEDVKTQIYRTRIAEVKSQMTEALFEYLKIQPNADFRLDIFSDSQIAELTQLHESGEFANRFVRGKANESDWKLIERKIDALNLSEERKAEFMSNLKSNKPTVIKGTLASIDSTYEILFIGSHTGRIYMPTQNLKNRVFNQFLYWQGTDIPSLLTINKLEADHIAKSGEVTERSILELKSEIFKKFTENKYALKIVPKTKDYVDVNDSYFNIGNYTVQIVSIESNDSVDNISDLKQSVVYGKNRSDVAYRSGKNTEMVDDILSPDRVKGYHVIDDVVANPLLLSDDIRKQIKEKYGEVTSEYTFRFLKQYFIDKTGDTSISLLQNGEIVFVNLEDSSKMIDPDQASKIKSGTTKLSDVVNSEYKIPFFENVTIVIGNNGTYLSNDGKAGRDKYVLHLDKSTGNIVTSIAHETQHAIQIANKLNYGNDGEILKKMYKADQKRVIQEVKEHLPQLFEGVDENEHEAIVNDFLYFASGEAEAYGNSFSDIVDFYPVVVKINNDRTSTVTLPWGTTIKTIKSNATSAKKYKNVQQMNDDYMKLATSKKSIEEFTPAELKKLQKLVDEIAELNGFDASTDLYHGTAKFGFTNFDTPLAFLTNNPELANIYATEDSSQEGMKFISTDYNRFRDRFKELLTKSVHDLNNASKDVSFLNRTYPDVEYVIDKNTGERFPVSELGKNYSILRGMDIMYLDNTTVEISADVIRFYDGFEQIEVNQKAFDEEFESNYKLFKNNKITLEELISITIESIIDLPSMYDGKNDTIIETITNDIKWNISAGRYRMYGFKVNQFVADTDNQRWDNLMPTNMPEITTAITTNELSDIIYKRGYDSIKMTNIEDPDPVEKGDVYVFFHPNKHLRSADPITYDNDGNVIPLTDRFKTESGDFRYAATKSPHGVVDEEIANRMPDKPSLARMKSLFTEFNEDKDVSKLFDRCYDIVEKLGLDFNFSDTDEAFLKPNEDGGYNVGYYDDVNNRIVYYRSYLASKDIKAQDKATVILHEMIHAVAKVYVQAIMKGRSDGRFWDPYNQRFAVLDKNVDFMDAKPGNGWSDPMKAALSLVQMYEHYNSISEDTDANYNAKKNADEFVAELSRPAFRALLKKESLWDKIITLLKRLLGFREKDMLSGAASAFDKILDSYKTKTPVKPVAFGRTFNLNSYSAVKSGGKANAQVDEKYSRRVAIKSSKGTNLEAFSGQQLSKELRGFIEDARYTPDGGINKGLWLKIKDGTLKRSDIFTYFYNTPGTARRDKNTFDLINKHFFKNRYIKSFEELDDKVTLLPQYYAIATILAEHDMLGDLAKINDPNLFDIFTNLVNQGRVNTKKYESIVSEYEHSVEYDTRAVRRLWMRKYDGSVSSIADVANVAMTLQKDPSIRRGTQIKAGSLDQTKKGKDGNERSLADLVGEKSFDDVVGPDEYFYLRLYTEGDEAYDDSSEALEVLAAFADDPDALREHVLSFLKDKDPNDPTIAAGLKQLALIMETGKADVNVDTDIEAAIVRASKRMSLRTPRNIVQNIRYLEKRINALLRGEKTSAATRKQFLKDADGLFDENFELIKSNYKTESGRYLDDVELVKLEHTLKELRDSIKEGLYNKNVLNLRKDEEAFMDSVKQVLKDYAKGKPVDFVLSKNEVRVDSDKPMPEPVKKMLNTQLDKSAPTRVQMLSKDNEIHAKIIMSKFVDDNIELLQNLTQGEVDEIVDYFLTTAMLPNTNEGIVYVSVKQFMFGYLLKANEEGGRQFALTDKQIEDIENHLRTMVSTASTIVVNWRQILRKYDLRAEEAKASMRFYDLNLSQETQNLVIKAVTAGDVTAMRNATKLAYDELKDKYKKRKTTIWEKMTNLQRVFMLSSPGTWTRNHISNFLIGGIKTKEGKVIVPGLNEITELMGLLPQTKASKRLAQRDVDERRKGVRKVYTQYKIVGTKVTSEVQTFLKNDLIDSGYLNLITDGLMKYSTGKLRSFGLSGVDKIVGLIKSGVENKLFDGTNKGQWLISKVMSDSYAVNRSMIRYLGKMLTEDGVDVSKGLTEDILPYIADAYVMAAQDYMHRPNFINKLEYWGKNYLRNTVGEQGAGIAFFLYKQILPFGAASWNWFVDKLNYTPLGLGKGIIDLIRLETTVDRMITAQSKGIQVRSQRFAEYLAKRRIGKGAIGSVLLLAGLLLRAFGKAGIDEEDDKYKIWVGSGADRIYIDLSNVHATNSLTVGMAIADGFIDGRNGDFNVDKFAKIMSNVFDEMLNDFVLTDVYNNFRYYDSFGEVVVDFPMQTLDMFIPKFLGSVSSVFRKHRIKYSTGLKGDLERLAGNFFAPFAEALGAQYWINPYTGKPEAINKYHWQTVVNKFAPFKINQYEVGETEEIAINLGISSSQLTGRYTINGDKVNLSGEKLYELNSYYGSLNAKEVDDFINGKTSYRVETSDGSYRTLRYNNMDDKQKKAVIERIMSNNSQLAKVYILTKDGEYKYYASESEYQELRKLGITTNVYRKTKKLEGFVKN